MAVILAVKYIPNTPTKRPKICQYAHLGSLPIYASKSKIIGMLNPNKWMKVVCFSQLTGFTNMANPAKKN